MAGKRARIIIGVENQRGDAMNWIVRPISHRERWGLWFEARGKPFDIATRNALDELTEG